MGAHAVKLSDTCLRLFTGISKLNLCVKTMSAVVSLVTPKLLTRLGRNNRNGRSKFRVLIRVRAINIFEHRSAAWARSRFQRCLRPPRSFPDQRIRIGETAGKIIE